MASRPWLRQHRRDEDALIDFAALLVALKQGGLRGNLRARRRQARHALGCVIDKLLHPDEARTVLCKSVIDGFGVRRKEKAARIARFPLDLLGGLDLLRATLWLLGQTRE